ncbi:ferredoxin-dependent bilin reductase [Rubidibacter lacunae KORDI 51-2]|uniref:Ferredoxin-dependent bilin reductase n=1 Tax=Rubidibacter lacunae KORDI 51-2 TaxID=582515 RepID=U5DM39_9CHRO|nr:15,16-dihydrobiliverdin:ferredoxin oxidoreductase [Rubidibacter lacunae]ERN41952.1 ferredoxin-dependent bilin reductase [Rubidibacter lacunae KORDI 51-2]
MYKPFQKYLEDSLFGRFELKETPIPTTLARQVSERGKNPATIQSWCYESSRLRKIRYTYIDAGESAQIFNSVIYPRVSFDLPLLGIDLLSFNNRKFLVVVDFQPLFRDIDYQQRYIEPMRPIYDRYRDLAQDLGMKFYDANQYFSKYLIFAKTDYETVEQRVFPAYQDYLNLYWEMLDAAVPFTDPRDIERIDQAHHDYDQYSADRDPAHGLFSSYFGHEWAERFLYEFLFDRAKPVSAGVKHP